MLFCKRPFIALLLVISLLLPAHFSAAQGPSDFVTEITSDEVMATIRALSVDIGPRLAGSEAETRADEYVAAAFREWGYDVTVQEFETDTDDGTITSHNVIATRSGDDQMVVVGAHLDSVDDGSGADDNASGVAAMLATAEALADVAVTHTLIFVAFGAEEVGDPMGSEIYVESLGDDIENVIAMLNVDTVGAGTHLDVYAGAEITYTDDEEDFTFEGGPTWVRDLAFDLADEMNLPVGTSPDDTWEGYTGDWSDHYAFVLAGVPIAYFDAWQWEDTADPWEGQETGEGDLIHTEDDVYKNIEPEKVERAAELVAATANALATGQAEPPAQ